MMGAVGKAMQAAFAADQAAASASEDRADRARSKQQEEQRAAVEAKYEAGLEGIQQAKEEAQIAAATAAISVATCFIGCIGGVGTAVQTGAKMASAGVGGAAQATSFGVTKDNREAITAAQHAAGLAEVHETRLEGQVDAAESDASDAKARARDNFRAALEMASGLGKARRMDGGES